MTQTTNNSWLHRFALLTAVATLALLGVGGLVTSHDVGMAVPDWPTSYGYNMFALPFKFWTGGVLFEHSHRLVASGVGLLTTILAVWLWVKEPRRWVKWLGVVAFFAVVLQGVLGGLRVVLFKDEIGIFHATLAQLFFALVCAIALFTSKWWTVNFIGPVNPPLTPPRRGTAEEARSLVCSPPGRGQGWVGSSDVSRDLGRLFLLTTVLIFLQLVLGATMRHQHAGLAIPDFPLAYGKLWPALDADSVAAYNARRVETTAANPITAFQIGLQMAHRLMAVGILIGVGLVAWRARRIGAPISGSARTGSDHQRADQEIGAPLRRLASVWLGLVLVQAALGAWTIWSNKAADVATAHVLVGALSLVTGMLGCIIAFRRLAGPVEISAPVVSSLGAERNDSFRESSAAVMTQ